MYTKRTKSSSYWFLQYTVASKIDIQITKYNIQQHERPQTPHLRTDMKISFQRRPAGSRGQEGPKRPPRAQMSVSRESVDKNYKLSLLGPKPPEGPQRPQAPKSALQKWAFRARVSIKTKK